MNSKKNVKLILKGTPIRLKYKNYDEGEEGEIIRLNSISEIKFTSFPIRIFKSINGYIVYSNP